MPAPYFDEALFAGLRELVNSAFPKRCGNCGREYRNSEEFFSVTQPLREDISGLKQSLDDNGNLIVDLFRNCICGSTLLESYGDRRNLSDEGITRRRRFQDMADKLVTIGCTPETARNELLKLVRGQPHDLLNLVKHKN